MILTLAWQPERSTGPDPGGISGQTPYPDEALLPPRPRSFDHRKRRGRVRGWRGQGCGDTI